MIKGIKLQVINYKLQVALIKVIIGLFNVQIIAIKNICMNVENDKPFN